MKEIIIAVIISLFVFTIPVVPKTNCIQSSKRYEGKPRADTFIVTVINNCDHNRIVTVTIMEATTLEELKKEKFVLGMSKTRSVAYRFRGEKLLGYDIYHREQ